ncbi:MAG: 3-phosphoserine/phosphohydroxythreonine transaminase [Proteobacteria bacterium]|nr:3-phosphoserine/phosphohydroxythreonine transaminase [Pseudomonadota bacterium]
MMTIYNFGAGPAVLPRDVLLQAQAELLDFRGHGVSIMEMSHRGPLFEALFEEIESDFRSLMAIPANYQVLFMQGGATAQFAMVPINLLRGKRQADYIVTGEWGQKAVSEASRFCDVHLAANTAVHGFVNVPDELEVDMASAYLHYTSNETIRGIEFKSIPDPQGLPLVCDMSSNILSRPVDISRFGLVYAGAQKNIGPSGLTLVIVRDDLLGEVLPQQSRLFDYRQVASQHSMLNTPPTFSIYMAGLVFKWLIRQGGLVAMQGINERKASKLYGCIDASSLYVCRVHPGARSCMNVAFYLQEESLYPLFFSQAAKEGFLQLKGHKLAGGVRASIYNAMPEAGVDALIAFMSEFERING